MLIFWGSCRGDGRGKYVRSPLTSNPIRNLTTTPLACNANNVPVPEVVDVLPGDKFTFEWYRASRGDDIIPSYAKGPSTYTLTQFVVPC